MTRSVFNLATIHVFLILHSLSDIFSSSLGVFGPSINLYIFINSSDTTGPTLIKHDKKHLQFHVSDWLKHKKKSPPKLLGQMEPNFIGRSFKKIAYFVSIGQKRWLPWTILVSDWLIVDTLKIFSETSWPNWFIFDINHLLKALYNIS